MRAAKRYRFLTVLSVALFAAVSARAEGARTASASLEVSAVVMPNCRLSVTPLGFGSYDPLGANNQNNLDATATVVITCTRDSRASVDMDYGRNAPSGAQSRFLTLGTERLNYDLFRDAARSQLWASGADSLSVVAQGIRSPVSVIVYGRIPPGQEVAAGTYNDVVTATVDF
jgi:spore coat protein U-like protein